MAEDSVFGQSFLKSWVFIRPPSKSRNAGRGGQAEPGADTRVSKGGHAFCPLSWAQPSAIQAHEGRVPGKVHTHVLCPGGSPEFSESRAREGCRTRGLRRCSPGTRILGSRRLLRGRAMLAVFFSLESSRGACPLRSLAEQKEKGKRQNTLTLPLSGTCRKRTPGTSQQSRIPDGNDGCHHRKGV